MNKRAVMDFLQNRSRRYKTDAPLKISLATVSGVGTTKTSLVAWADRTILPLSLITTKSYQCVPNAGNREPIICEMDEGCFGNSVGLRNCGMDQAVSELTALRKKHIRCFLVVSVSGSTPDEFIRLVQAFDSVADIIELNFSCPHAAAGYGAAIGSSKEVSAEFVRKIRRAYPAQESALFVKLTPNVPNIGEIARAVCDAGCDGLSAINTAGPDIHIHPQTNTPILQNTLGGRGGKSGAWVRETALQAVRNIRSAVGYAVPLLGMGGAASGADVYNLIQAGADSVGIGSALAAVHQDNWAHYFAAIAQEASLLFEDRLYTPLSRRFVQTGLRMQYMPLRITAVEHPCPDTALITVDADISARAGEFVFLWLPQIGEKPFSLAGIHPPQFVIKKRGAVSSALCALERGDTVYMRGIYGAPIQHTIQNTSYIFCGGTGIALAPLLCRELENKSAIKVFLGMSGVDPHNSESRLFERELSQKAAYHCVYDNGTLGRVLRHIPAVFEESSALYVIGPAAFMKKAVQTAVAAGLSPEHIYVSLEQHTMCGIGVCGECAANHILTCRSGTFFTAHFLQKENLL